MIRFAWIAACIAVVGLASGCKSSEEAPTSGGVARPPAQPPSTPPAPKGPSAAETAERFDACVAALNRRAKDEALACYATSEVELALLDDIQDEALDARTPQKISQHLETALAASPDQKATPQVTVVGPGWAAAMMLGTGTISGKPVSALYAQLVWFDDAAKIRRDLRLIDQATLAHQLQTGSSPSAPRAETPREAPAVEIVRPEEASAIETRVQIVENLQQAMQTKSLETIAAHLADDVAFRYVAHASSIQGKKAYVESLTAMAAMFSKMERKLVGAMGAGNWVVAHSVVTASPSADLPGAPGSAGTSVTTHQIEFYRFAGTEIAEHWVFENSAQWGAQLAPAAPPTP